MPFSDYIIFADESGSSSPKPDPTYPAFILAFCIFKKSDYMSIVVPKVQELKFQFFGHDDIILHEADIRRRRGEFSVLNDETTNWQFLQATSTLISDVPFEIVASVVDKRSPVIDAEKDLYEIALHSCLERTCLFLDDQSESNRLTHLLLEERGKKEDRRLEEAFKRFRATEGGPMSAQSLCIRFPNKLANSAGTQLADLVARPIGLSFLRPDQSNRAWEVIESKLQSNEELNPQLERIRVIEPSAKGLGP